ncbi:MAG: hypothetical protein KAR23_04825, partial [Candidatus Aenigmarchaeota archaeon]|nr:hypothetical protein [Candidatus Aenigmarchaeota archaeon]
WANDTAGNTVTETVTFTVDTGSPVVSLETPEDQVYLAESLVELNWTVIDSVDTLLECNVTVNSAVNNNDSLSAINGSETNYTVSLIDGMYTWNVVCIDEAGNEGTVVEDRMFVVDTVAPDITSVSMTDHVVQNNTQVTVTVAVVELNLKNVTVEDEVLTDGNGCSEGVCTVVLNLTDGGDGHIDITAYDYANNSAYNDTLWYTIDDNAPIINSAELDDYYVKSGASVLVTVDVSDVGGTGVAVVQVLANGQALDQYLSGDIWNGTITVTGDGDTLVNINVTDNASNVNSTTIAYYIDNQVPVVTVNSPGEDVVIVNETGNVTLNWTVTERNLTVSNVSIDSVSVVSVTDNGTSSTLVEDLSAGTHFALFYALDEAGNEVFVNRTFIINRQENVTEKMDSIVDSNSGVISNATLIVNGTEVNGTQWLNQSVTLEMEINVSGLNGTTVEIPDFSGLDANWNKTDFASVVNVTSPEALNISANAGTNLTAFVLFVNVSDFLPLSAFDNGARIFFNQSLGNLDVLYFADDLGSKVYKLGFCENGIAPSGPITLENMC